MHRMIVKITAYVLFIFILSSCGSEKTDPASEQADIDYEIILSENKKPVSYINEARPILEKRCIVCHGCYDAPCQLKLTSVEAIIRGANPEKVYDAERIMAVQPTRMYVDAHTEKEWREKGFHTVLNKQQENALNNLRHSVLYKILRQKQLNPQPRVGMINAQIELDLNREQSCPTDSEYADYANKFPLQGMPFAMPNLSDKEYHTLVKWISQGLPDDSKKDISILAKNQIVKWEEFLNIVDNKHRLFSRYLYEHLFLGHLYLKDGTDREFFRLVRSYTPPGEEIKEISSLRVFDDPGVSIFYYRLKKHTASIVDKNHIVYELSDQRMSRYKDLFIRPDYHVNKLPSYKAEIASNPFKTFADLPVKSRYQFLLDDAKYFIEGFIKGPVCRGQVALNVIEDNFWVFFTDPEKIEINNNDNYLDKMADELRLPAEQGNTLNLFSIWTRYWDSQREYMLKRQQQFESMPKVSLQQAMNYIWSGENSLDEDNRALTIFRHFDSASVKQGLLGDYPETSWILDYPLLERIHYLLVAGYDVYGNIGHQLNTRLYMDFLRMEAENSFLAFMPVSHRKKIQDSWYVGIRENTKAIFDQPSDWLTVQVVYGFKTGDPQRELYTLLEKRQADSINQKDVINRCNSEQCKHDNLLSPIEQQLQKVSRIKGEILDVFPDVALLKINRKAADEVYTLIHNKAYKNISFILDDVDGRDKSMDSLTVYKGILGAYPNFFFTVDETDLNNFTDRLINIKNRDDYERFVGLYGVRRTSSNFWSVADWMYQRHAEDSPVAYGVLDLNRYSNQ